MYRNDLLTDISKERVNFDSSDKIIEATSDILQAKYNLSKDESDYQTNILKIASNLYHRNPDMLAAAISLYIQSNEEMPTKDMIDNFLKSNKHNLSNLRQIRSNKLEVHELYVRELVKYLRYIRIIRDRFYR